MTIIKRGMVLGGAWWGGCWFNTAIVRWRQVWCHRNITFLTFELQHSHCVGLCCNVSESNLLFEGFY